jgi:hypothetical protein
MRIILPSASIAAFTGTCLVSADKIGADHQVTHHHEQRLVLSQITRDVDESLKSSSTRKRSLNAECNTFNSGDDGAARNSENGFADVGILGCGPNQICEPNESSTLGGRCTMSSASAQMKLPGTPVTRAAFSNRHGRRTNQKQRALRFLQESDGTTTNTTSDYEEKVCPPNCPQQFCDCAHADGDAEKCASELHSVCINDLLSSCVPDSFITFYTDTYCPFASCIALEGKSYEECSCAYYQNYCDVYYAYMESIEKCAVANCCDGQPDGMKYSCIPGMEPTSNPTLAPIFSPHPSSSPTVSYYCALFHPSHNSPCVYADISTTFTSLLVN